MNVAIRAEIKAIVDIRKSFVPIPGIENTNTAIITQSNRIKVFPKGISDKYRKRLKDLFALFTYLRAS